MFEFRPTRSDEIRMKLIQNWSDSYQTVIQSTFVSTVERKSDDISPEMVGLVLNSRRQSDKTG